MTVRILVGEHNEFFIGEDLSQVMYDWETGRWGKIDNYWRFLQKMSNMGYNFITLDGVLMYINPNFVVFKEEIAKDGIE